MSDYTQNLVIHFVCHQDDVRVASPLIDVLCSAFSRNPEFPYSSEINIPLFVWRGEEFDRNILDPRRIAKKVVVFVFSSAKSCIDNDWLKALKRINKGRKGIYVVPIALNNGGLAIPSGVGFNNIISYFKFEKAKEDMLVLFAAQAISQHCYCKRNRSGLLSSLEVFLSHTKSDDIGKRIVKEVRDFICTETSLQKFIDLNDIQAGEPFNKRIFKEVKNSAFLAIVTDNYSTRRWCQLEAVEAKRCEVPIVVMNCVVQHEDRILPALANVPSVRPSINTNPNEKVLSYNDIVRVLKVLMVESLRCYYVKDSLSCVYKNDYIQIRPPEADVLHQHKAERVRYPNPMILPEEKEYYFGGQRKIFAAAEVDGLERSLCMRIGISISNPEMDVLEKDGLRGDVLERLSQDIAQNLLSRNATIIYGGDLRPREEHGFTAMILAEAKLARHRFKTSRPLVHNYLAWPISQKKDDEAAGFLCRYVDVVKSMRMKAPNDILKAGDVNPKKYFETKTAKEWYLWSRGLTDMRNRSISLSDARICAGGKLSNYSGSMPGVLEEILIAVEKNRPVYLLGGFGGIVAAIVSSVREKVIDSRLHKEWQVNHSLGYSDFLTYAESQKHPVEYSRINAIAKWSIKRLANDAGLKEKEYERLMVSPFVDECLHLILKGLSALKVKKINRKARRG